MASHDNYAGEYSRRSTEDQIERAIAVLARVKRGELKREDIPWDNAMLQEAIMRTLRDLPALERDAEHLAIVKSVFRGTK
jgi:hypothetical protein